MGNLIFMANIRDSKVSLGVGGLTSLGLERKLYEEQVS